MNFLKKSINNLISVFIIFNFVIVQPINAASVGITATQRTIEVQDDMLKTGTPSDLPISGYSDFFDKETVSLVKSFDITPYENMKIMVGYGVPDKNSNNCKMSEKPGVTKNDFDTQFIRFFVFNDHSYGLSKNDTTYDDCLATANAYGGYPVVIDSAGENNSIKHTFLTFGSPDTLWVGAAFPNAASPTYYNAFGNKQTYFNWKTGQEFAFDVNKANISMDAFGKWTKENSGLIKTCIIEVESPTYYKPIRSCAPWWKIIREYKNDRESLYNRKDFNKYLNVDMPEKLSICTKYDLDSIAPTDENTPVRDVTCTSYQSMTEKPECSRMIDLPQCYVNECSGYIQNACRHKSEKIVGKGYVKGEMLINGAMTEVKLKDQVVTHSFECPPSSISMKHCLETSEVVIFPQECTYVDKDGTIPSECTSLKLCVQDARTNEAIDACYDTTIGGFGCQKIYAGRDIPPKLTAGGDVELLYGKCPNDEVLEFVPNILNKKSKHCVEREEIIIHEEISQKCQTDRTYSEHEIDTSITEVDIYQDREDCVRVDKVKDSEVATNINLTVDLYNFSKLKVTQTYVDDSEEIVGQIVGDDAYYIAISDPKTNITGGDLNSASSTTSTNNLAETTSSCDLTTVADCSIYVDQNWHLKNANILLDIDLVTEIDTKDNEVAYIENGNVYAKNTIANLSSADCDTFAVDHGFNTYVNGAVTYSKNDLSGSAECVIPVVTHSADGGIERITGLTDTSTNFLFASTSMTKLDCMKKAYCLTGAYNESPYGSTWTSTGECSVTVSEQGSPTSYTDKIKELAGCDATASNDVAIFDESTCKPIEDIASSTFSTTIDGVQSILFFEETVGGGWGYYSNNNAYPFKSNEVFLTADDITNKRVFPLVEVTTINDRLTYESNILHYGHRAGEPDLVTAAVGGAGAGVIAVQVLLYSTPIGWAIGIIVFVILLLFSKSEKMDSQDQIWIIYKNIPDDRYIKGPYETRIQMGNPYVQSAMDGATLNITAPANTKNFMYMTMTTNTGVNLPEEYLKTLAGYTQAKKNLIMCSGIASTEMTKTIDGLEGGISTGYPKCKWYKPWCEKKDLAANVHPKLELIKPMTNIYMGATETLTVLVPYKGDYTVKAYNKYDEIIASRDVTEDTFSNFFDDTAVPYGKVQFGAAMETSVNLGAGKACEDDAMVEWGGGVSGIYYENDETGINQGCAKSDDNYVWEQAMVKIEVTPNNLDDGFVHILDKPMPYPNRVFIASLEKTSKRKYRCYDPFEACDDEDYKQEEE